ncbi:chitin synthesis regulation, resistance to congo red-domain-containing protein [Annulohypoxylon truncatum]|uniref:chitin synthesis regulation, resistance to congo red-domain-containing protein n=1 Tax=Annulohypoxylon truncatum TaxID=327061 RepID=UPI0020080FF0|nr:chitin synthesis regulation, resistance to congo red-domain-containing protein [Annulohypoxylon truncatum]KAI1208767.1 chitin synthesis regulation, resistance to congo red-domain-containing protein [Annulohypoxylon truncatum]
MAPFIDQVGAELAKRQRYCDNGYYDRYGNCYSAWNWYGRWIFAAVVIVLILAVFFLWACINSRRRRRQGLQPMYGTGWMAGNQGQNAYYNNNNPQGYSAHPPPPAYGQAYPMDNQYTGTTFNRDDGYYGQHEGVVQPPKNVYNNGAAKTDYAPPEGPPPNR